MAKQGEVKIGDKIRITNASAPFGSYLNGDVLTVKSFYALNKVHVEEFESPWVGFNEFEVMEQATEEAPKPEVGDMIVLHEDSLDITAGKAYEVTGVFEDRCVDFVDDEGDEAYAEPHEYTLFKRVTPPAPVDPPKPAYEPQVGDIVKVMESQAHGSDHKEGAIGEVTELSRYGEFRVKTAAIDSVNWVQPHHVELIVKAEDRADIA
jgi:hypothetical protein